MNNYLHWCLLEDAEIKDSVTLPKSLSTDLKGGEDVEIRRVHSQMRNSLERLTTPGSTRKQRHHKRLTLVPGHANGSGAQLSNSMADLLAQNKLSSSSSNGLEATKCIVKSLDAKHFVGGENGSVGDDDDDMDMGRQSEIITRKEKGANLEMRRRKSLASDELTDVARSILNQGHSALNETDDNTGSGTVQDTAVKDISDSDSSGNLGSMKFMRVLSQADVFEHLGKKGSIYSVDLSTYSSAASAFRSRRETVTSTTTDGFELPPVDFKVRV